jgi:hypothetical protein
LSLHYAPYIQARLLHLNSNFEELMQLYFKFDAFHAYGASLLAWRVVVALIVVAEVNELRL